MRSTEFITALQKGQVGAAYFLRGPDRFFQEECRKAVVNSIPADSRQWCLAELEFAAGQLPPRWKAPSRCPCWAGTIFCSFPTRKTSSKPATRMWKRCAATWSAPPPFRRWFLSPRSRTGGGASFSCSKKKLQLVELRSPDRREAADWVKQFLAEEGVEIAAGLAEEIAGKFESSQDSRSAGGPSAVNLLWMRTELEKLLTARPGLRRVERCGPGGAGRVSRGARDRQAAARHRSSASAPWRWLHCGSCWPARWRKRLILWCIGDLFRQALRGVPSYGNRGGWSRGANPYATSEMRPSRRRTIPAKSCCRPCARCAVPIWGSSLRGRIRGFCWNFWSGKSWSERNPRPTRPWAAKFYCR